MNIALLFNAFSYPQKGNYWEAIRDLVFSTNIIQSTNRHMRLSVGDVHVGFRRGDDPEVIFHNVFLESKWRLVHESRLDAAFERAVIFAMLFENMPIEVAKKIHHAISFDPGYLGVMAVSFEYPPHLARYRNSLPTMYRLKGSSCRAFFSMSQEDGKDVFDLEEMKRLGYNDVDWEDRGAHGTILDDFDTPNHFRRIALFRDSIAPWLDGGEDAAYELVMVLEDLSPKLFDALGAAVERLVAAETEEEVAQAALSGRRYIEQLADVLFPAQESNVKKGGRSLGKTAYKNRIWAFIEHHSAGDLIKITTMGKEVDRLVEEMNGGLHSNFPRERVLKAFADVAKITEHLLALNPGEARKPYYAFSPRIREFLKEAFGSQLESDEENK